MTVFEDVYVDCLGEHVTFTGEVSYGYRGATTSSGGRDFEYLILPATSKPPFLAVTQGTGTVYESRGSPETMLGHGAAGETFTFPDRQTYMAGDRWFVLTSHIHTTANAEGQLTADGFEDYSAMCH